MELTLVVVPRSVRSASKGRKDQSQLSGRMAVRDGGGGGRMMRRSSSSSVPSTRSMTNRNDSLTNPQPKALQWRTKKEAWVRQGEFQTNIRENNSKLNIILCYVYTRKVIHL